MGSVRWTPELGTRALVAGVGASRALALLGPLAAGRVTVAAMVDAPYSEVIHCIGRCDAAVFLRAGTADHLAYWPRSWAARSLAHLRDESASPWLVEAFGDPHWRVRMAAARAIGRLTADGHDEDLATLANDPHPRVRAAAVVALGRTGNEFAVAPLRAALADPDATVRRAADRGLARVEERLDRYGR
jgi:hypothetical protein